jgi:very-short-patch-repair endonuclease
MIHTASEAGRITRLATGVYIASSAVATDPIARHLHMAIAQQLLRPTAIASHHTAALAWGLDLVDAHASAEAKVAFIRPPGSGVRSETTSEATFAVRTLPHHHRTEHASGLLVTTPARTAVDVAAELGTPEALITLDSVARLCLREHVGSSRLRDHYPSPRHIAAALAPLQEAAPLAGTRLTRLRLEHLVSLADPRRESGLESLSFGHMVDVGFPLPELQVRIPTPEGDAHVDFLWRGQMVIGEADGLKKYTIEADLHLEKLRQEALERMGFLVVRWTWQEMHRRPAGVLRRIEAALDARSGL